MNTPGSIVPADAKAVKQAARLLREGGVVAFPTETVYGLGADAFNPRAAARVFEIKNRPHFDPLIVHVSGRKQLRLLCEEPGPEAEKLMDLFWPGPLTLVLPKKESVPDIVTSGLPTVAVRMPAHDTALELIRKAKTPLAAPSANPFSYLSPTTAPHVAAQLGARVDLILDGGPCSVGVESTILDVSGGELVLLRSGGISVEEIEKALGRKVSLRAPDPDKVTAPGQLERHYSPRTPLRLVKRHEHAEPGPSAGLLCLRPPGKAPPFAHTEILSVSGDLREAAANLFQCLHRLDAAGLSVIYAEEVPDEGLGRAIMDRLRRAAKTAGGMNGTGSLRDK